MKKQREDFYVQCVQSHVMETGETTHTQGAIYPARFEHDRVWVAESETGDINHEMPTDNGHFDAHFKRVNVTISEYVPPRPERTMEEYFELIDNIKCKSTQLPSIEIFGDKSGNLNLDEGVDYDDIYAFADLDELEYLLRKHGALA